MSNTLKRSFDWRSFIRSVAVIAVPIALQNLLSTTGSMIDTLMISSLGENSIGAVGLCAQFSSLMFSCYWGFVGGGMLFFSQFYGAGDEKGVCRSYGLTWCAMMSVGFIFCLLACLLPGTVMRIYTDKQAIQDIGIEYLGIVGLAYPMQVFSMAASALLRSTGKVRIPLYAAIASVLTNMLFNWLFIFGNLGFPCLGVRGAALATVIAAFVNLITVLLLAKWQHYPFLFRIRQHFAFTGRHVREYFRKCFPIICNELLIGVGNMVMNIVLGRQAEEAIAALAVFRTFEGLIIGFFAGFSNASSVLVGTCVGGGQPRLAYERAKRVVLLCCSCIAMISLLMISFRKPLLHMMNLTNGFDYGCGLLIIYGIVCIIRMGNWTMNDTYRTAGDTVTGTVLEIVFMYVLVLPCVCLSGLKFGWPFLIVFALCYVDEPIRFVVMLRHLFSGKWIKPVTPEGKMAMAEFRSEMNKNK